MLGTRGTGSSADQLESKGAWRAGPTLPLPRRRLAPGRRPALDLQNRRPGAQTFFGPFGFLEGDEMIFVDGEMTPSIVGTGTEDYFGGGFYFENGPIAAPYHGVLIKDEALARVSAYRWHVEDAMPFARAIRVTIEHGSQNDNEGD